VPAAEIAFRDHHGYQPCDIGRLLAAKEKSDADGFLTTEKDAVNLGPLAAQLKPLALAPLTISLENAADAVDTILARIKK
jgi:tetraacyldisaccharide 4'-kinase